MGEWMAIEDAAFFLKISRSSVSKYIKNGKLHAYWHNNCLGVDQDELCGFILPHEDV
jgi:predicted transcriptional regulator